MTRSTARSAVLALPRVRAGKPDDGALALLLLSISAAGSLGCIGLALAGHTHTGLQAAAAAVLLIFGLLAA